MAFRHLLVFLPLALNAVDPQEVRIRSGAWTPPSTRISVESRMVEIGVTVRDRKGNLVDGLQVSDFEVLDSGKVEPITFFAEHKGAPIAGANAEPATIAPQPSAAPAAPAAAPRTIALYFDDVHAEPFGLNRAKAAAEKLVIAGFPTGDRAGVFTASGLVTEEFTGDSSKLLAAIARLRIHHRTGNQGVGVCPTLTAYQALVIVTHQDPMAKEVAVRETIACNCQAGDPDCPRHQEKVVETAAQTVWEQVAAESEGALDSLHAVLRHLAGAPGGRLLLWMSPGFPLGGMERRIDAIVDAAIRARIVINSLDATGLATISPEALNNRDGFRYDWAQRTQNTRQAILTSLMASISPATGGQLIGNTNDFDTAVRRLSTPAEESYVLGIAPAGAADERYHPIKVLVKKTGAYKIESRAGYFASPPEKKPETPQERIDRMVTSKESATDFPATVEVSSAPAKDGQLAIKVTMLVDAKGLDFAERDARHLQQLIFVTVLEDGAGNCVMGKQAAMDLEVTDATLGDMRARGIRTSTSFNAPKGAYVVRTVIREGYNGGMAAGRSPVELR